MARRALAALASAVVLASCTFAGAEITVDARNDSDFVMRVQVVDGTGRPFGPTHFVDPLAERALELAVPGGEWTVMVNEARLLGSDESAGRTGHLPVTLVFPAPDDPAPGPYADWAGQ